MSIGYEKIFDNVKHHDIPINKVKRIKLHTVAYYQKTKSDTKHMLVMLVCRLK